MGYSYSAERQYGRAQLAILRHPQLGRNLAHNLGKATNLMSEARSLEPAFAMTRDEDLPRVGMRGATANFSGTISHMTSQHNDLLAKNHCPCGTGRTFSQCCGRYITPPFAAAPTAEALMRSRFTAFATNNAAYLGYSWAAATCPPEFSNPDDTWASEVRFTHLRIVRTTKGSPFDQTGTVHFQAFYEGGVMEEDSSFIRQDGRWVYLTGNVRD